MNATFLSPTPFGPVAVVWSADSGRPLVRRVVLPTLEARAEELAARLCGNLRTASCAAIDAVCRDLRAFLEGADVRFSLGVADIASCPAFQRAVLAAEHAVPRGSVTTYRLLATRVGRPRAARAAGTALARNPFPIIVPCHRAVRSDGTLGGFQGGLGMKQALLAREGVALDARGRVCVARYHYAGV